MIASDRLTLLARLGFAARGIVYILIGALAVNAAWKGGNPTDNQGALGTIADAPFGRFLLAVCAAGFAGYAIWRFTEAALDPERRSESLKGRVERAGYALSAIAHAVLAFSAARIALGQAPAREGSPGDESAQSWSAWLMEQPGGVALLIAVGIGLFGVAIAQGLKAYKADFDDLGGDVPAPDYVQWLGRAGYAARAVVFAITGWLIISAALAHDGSRAGGLGEALDRLGSQPGGALLLALMGVGLGLFGAFSLVEARYRVLTVRSPF
ncbi:DUF1206 domain-containing protein [Novosphingobium panipatense]|uniref:DUF1206 domain-containing protein n=1 Tax=Novosphingobium TaxID=165696 RepID=UPI001304B2D9|nr:DUF1206 domain-containing protein [Novosphingobium sp. HII-3]